MVLRIGLVMFIAFALIAAGGCGGGSGSSGGGGAGNSAPHTVFKADAGTLPGTTMTAHLREPHAAGKNLVWCASMQMAWDEAANHFGGTMPLDGTPLMGKTLDERLVAASDLDPASYVALGGFRRDGIEAKIRDAITAKFGAGNAPSLLGPPGGEPDDLIAYAYLLKNLEFETPFLPNTAEPLLFGGKTQVNSFGLWPEVDTRNWGEIAGQVLVWNYAEGGEFIVELKTKSEQDRLILARIDPEATLKDDIDKVLPRLKGTAVWMTGVDTFKAPAMDFDLLRTYHEVMEKAVLKPCLDTKSNQKSYVITDARQTAQFKLDEHGAILKSEAVVGVGPGAGPPQDYQPPKPKRLVFDKPYLLLLLRKDAKMPYFALWVDNTELLQAAK